MSKSIFVLGNQSRALVSLRGSLLEALVAEGYAVHAAAPGIAADERTQVWLSERGIVAHDLSLHRTGLNPMREVALMLSLSRQLAVLKPDLFLAFTIKPAIWGTLAAWIARVPRRFVLITGLGYAFTENGGGRRILIRRIVMLLYRLALSKSCAVIFQNADDWAEFRKRGLLENEKRFLVVNGSGVDLVKFAPLPIPEIKSSITFIMVARLLVTKGVLEFGKAALQLRTRYPDSRFILVGPRDSNPDAIDETLPETWRTNGSIEWVGEQADVRVWLAKSHVFVLPSYREGTSKAVLEALASGRPIVTTDAPGCRETVVQGVNGFLVPAGNAGELESAMERFLAEPVLIKEMGASSRLYAETKFDAREVNQSMMEFMGIL